ncbi:hypothetical protein [Candidatus Cytomitobacter primus]|uniref:ATPase subunit I n=1 Tax=Candidatus Cytomitobacter primus TaxID=2066024 RepID=A0A5C0UHU2_9PROT|nr:hypothetical protein [Candidatus Cytomitobacter primus]QEK38514.1 hypothetical protein FZC34_01155 [Candidatus Cytomitobacter primus]
MSVKFLYELISFIIAGVIFKKFAFPHIMRFISEYKNAIVNQMSDLEFQIHEKSVIYKDLHLDQLYMEKEYENFEKNMEKKLNAYEKQLTDKYDMMIADRENILFSDVENATQKYELKIQKLSIDMLYSEIEKQIKNSAKHSEEILHNLCRIDMKYLLFNKKA